MKIYLLTFLLLLFMGSFFGQKEFTVKDETTFENIPFVKVYPNNGQALLCDIDGRFLISDTTIYAVRLSYSGYKDTTYLLDSVVGSTLYIRLKTQEIEEITIVPGENPAHRIIDQVIANRKKNNPMDGEGFRYTSYSKVQFDMDSSSLQLFVKMAGDSSKARLKDFLEKNFLLMIESSSIRTFFPPARDKEEIVAYKVSGFTDPLLATFAKNLQSFSFYENQFSIGGLSFINPIALGGTKRYLFILEDSTFVGKDTLYHIAFRPRKGKNFEGLSGKLYINTKGYAVEKVIAEPSDPNTPLPIKIIQEYHFLNDKKWFPNKLSTEFSIPVISANESIKQLNVTGKSSTYIESVELNPEKVSLFLSNNANIVVQDDADKKAETEWQEYRKFQLSEREQNTYGSWDTLMEKSGVDKQMYAMKVLLTGKIPLKWFNADLSRILRYNQYEKFRLGLGLETSKRLFKPATLGGYFAYGFGDEAWKYGGKLNLHLYPKKQVDLAFIFENDAVERGGRAYPDNSAAFNSPERIRRYYINQMDSERLAKIKLSAFVSANCNLGFYGSYSRFHFNEGYTFAKNNDFGSPLKTMDVALVGAEFSWRIREKVMLVGDKYTPISPTQYPVVFVKAEQALPDFEKSNSSFARLHIEMKQLVSIRGVGKFNYSLSYGKTFGQAPLTFAQTVFNSSFDRKNLGYSVPGSFETVNSSLFYMQELASIVTGFHFNKWKTLSKSFQPQISVHHAIGYGVKANASVHLNIPPYNGMEKGYYEAGLLINELIGSSLSKIGVGGFYHYGPYSQPQVHKNIFVKITLGMILQ